MNYKKIGQIEKLAIKDYITSLLRVGGIKPISYMKYVVDVTEIASEYIENLESNHRVVISFDKNNHFYNRFTENVLSNLTYDEGTKKIVDLMYETFVNFMLNGMVIDYFDVLVLDSTLATDSSGEGYVYLESSILYEITETYSEVPMQIVIKMFENGSAYVSNYEQFTQPSSYSTKVSDVDAIQFTGYNQKEIDKWVKSIDENVNIVYDLYNSKPSRVIKFKMTSDALNVCKTDYVVKLTDGQVVSMTESVFNDFFYVKEDEIVEE